MLTGRLEDFVIRYTRVHCELQCLSGFLASILSNIDLVMAGEYSGAIHVVAFWVCSVNCD